MNIILLTSLNPEDINCWSGTVYHIFEILKEKHNVKVIGEFSLSQTNHFIKNNFLEKYSFDNYVLVLGKILTERIKQAFECDLVFFGDLYFTPFLDIDIPIIHLSDINYHLFKNYWNENQRNH